MDINMLIKMLSDYSLPTVVIIVLCYVIIKLLNIVVFTKMSQKSSSISHNNSHSNTINQSLCYNNNAELKILKEKLSQNQVQLEKLETAVYQMLDKNNEDHNKIALILQKIADLTESTIDILNKIS